MQNPYGPAPQSNMYPSGRVSPSPYGPAPNPYGPPPGGYPYSPQHGYPQQPGSFPQGYPQHSGSYPQGYPSNNPYPSQPGPYPGTSVVYPVSINDPYPYQPQPSQGNPGSTSFLGYLPGAEFIFVSTLKGFDLLFFISILIV